MSPTYLGHPISDEELQKMIAAYREGYKQAGGDAEADQGDQVILDRLEEEQILTDLGAAALGQQDGDIDSTAGAKG